MTQNADWHFVVERFHSITNQLCDNSKLFNKHKSTLKKRRALVDRAYGRSFADDAERVAHLFSLYAKAVGSGKR